MQENDLKAVLHSKILTRFKSFVNQNRLKKSLKRHTLQIVEGKNWGILKEIGSQKN